MYLLGVELYLAAAVIFLAETGTGLSDFPLRTRSAQDVDLARGFGGRDIQDCTDPEDMVERPDSESTSTSLNSPSMSSEPVEALDSLLLVLLIICGSGVVEDGFTSDLGFATSVGFVFDDTSRQEE